MALVHARVTQPQPYGCAQCGQSFPLKKTLKRHQNSVHGVAAYVCDFPECLQVFKRKDILKRHLSEQHGDEAERKEWCDQCKIYVHRRTFLEHRRSVCHESFERSKLEQGTVEARAASHAIPISRPIRELDADPFVLAVLLWSEFGRLGRWRRRMEVSSLATQTLCSVNRTARPCFALSQTLTSIWAELHGRCDSFAS